MSGALPLSSPAVRPWVGVPLLLPAVLAWLTAVVGVVADPRTTGRLTWAAGGLMMLLLAALGLGARPGRAIAIGVLLALGAILITAISSRHHVERLRSGPVPVLARTSESAVYLDATLVGDPRPVLTRSGAALTVVDVTATSVWDGRWHTANTPLLVLSNADGWTGLLPGQRVELAGRLSPARTGDDVAALLDARGPPYPVGHPPWWQRAAGHVRASFLQATTGLPANVRGLLPGLVDGDTSRIPPAQKTALQVTGLTHLDAVSGENVSVVLAVVTALARTIGLRRGLRTVVGAVALLAFVVLARPSPSVLRAAVMGTVVLVSTVAGRRTSSLGALSLAVLVLVVVNPFLARTIGFSLSVVATAALITVAPSWTRWLARVVPAPVAASIAVPAAAQLACTPLLVASFGQLTPYAIPANLLAAPAVPAATILGVVCAVTSVVAMPIAVIVAAVAAVPTVVIATVASVLSRAPGADLAWPGWWWASLWLAFAAVVTVVGLRWRRAHEIVTTCPP